MFSNAGGRDVQVDLVIVRYESSRVVQHLMRALLLARNF